MLAPSFFITNFFHSDNVLGFTDVKMVILEQFYQKLIFSFVFQLPFNSFFRKFSYNNIPLALIFSTSTKSDPNPNHIKIYRLLVSTVNYIWIKFGLLSSQSTLTNFAGQLCSLQSFPTFLLFDNTVGDNDLLSDVILRIQRSSPSPSLFCFSFICGGGGVGVGSGASGWWFLGRPRKEYFKVNFSPKKELTKLTFANFCNQHWETFCSEISYVFYLAAADKKCEGDQIFVVFPDFKVCIDFPPN